jgi:hypothetical protein
VYASRGYEKQRPRSRTLPRSYGEGFGYLLRVGGHSDGALSSQAIGDANCAAAKAAARDLAHAGVVKGDSSSRGDALRVKVHEKIAAMERLSTASATLAGPDALEHQSLVCILGDGERRRTFMRDRDMFTPAKAVIGWGDQA